MASLFRAAPQLFNFRTSIFAPNFSSPPIISYPLTSRTVCALKTASDGERVDLRHAPGMLRKPVSSSTTDNEEEEGVAEEESGDEEVEGSESSWMDWEDQILEDTVPLVGFVRMLLHSQRYASGERLSPEHEKTILEKLLPNHPAYEDKVGCGVDYVTVDFHPNFDTSRCLFIVRKDGEMVDFSYWKCIKGLIKKNYPLYADSFILRHFRKQKDTQSEREEMWHEARKSERKVHDMMDAARKRAQRRAVYLAKRRGDPQQFIQVVGSRCRMYRDDGLYQATQDQQGLIPWNGKEDVLIDRFDGRALLDFIREANSRHRRVQDKTEEEEELEEFVSFERYRDLIKHRRRGFTDEEGLQHVNQEIETKNTIPFASDRSLLPQSSASKGSYSQVGFSYEGDGKEDMHFSDDDEEEDEEEEEEEEFNSDDSNDEGMDTIAKEFGIKRYGWLVYMDKKAKEEERRQKAVIKGDPAIRKLSRKERRKASQIEREKERDAARFSGARILHHDPYRESRQSPTYDAYPRSRRSRSRSYSPSHSRRYARNVHTDDSHRSKSKTPKVEYITEFGGSADASEPKLAGLSPPSSPPAQADLLSRQTPGRILEALHVDPASGVSLEKDKNPTKVPKPSLSTSSALAKLSKTAAAAGTLKQGEKKETPQERLKRIMSLQLNKQIKKDTAAEMAKKREQERQKSEKLAESSRQSRYRHRSRSRSDSRSPPRRRRRSRSPSRSKTPPSRSRSSRRYYSRSRSPSRSPSPKRYSRSRSRSSARSQSPNRPRSPRVKSRSRR